MERFLCLVSSSSSSFSSSSAILGIYPSFPSSHKMLSRIVRGGRMPGAYVIFLLKLRYCSYTLLSEIRYLVMEECSS
jgi:hypothetical protein